MAEDESAVAEDEPAVANAQSPTEGLVIVLMRARSAERCQVDTEFISSLELIEFIDAGRSIMAVNGDDQRKPDGCFRGGDGNGKNCDHHASR